MKNKNIKLITDTGVYEDISNLMPLQGGMKYLTLSNKEKLKQSIINNGLILPFYVWKEGSTKYIFDAHQRRKCLMELFEEGYSINGSNAVPVVYVKASTRKEALSLLIEKENVYSNFDLDELDKIIKEINVDYFEAALPSVTGIIKYTQDTLLDDMQKADPPKKVLKTNVSNYNYILLKVLDKDFFEVIEILEKLHKKNKIEIYKGQVDYE